MTVLDHEQELEDALKELRSSEEELGQFRRDTSIDGVMIATADNAKTLKTLLQKKLRTLRSV